MKGMRWQIPDMRWINSFQFILGQVRKVSITGCHKIARKDSDLAIALASPPAVIAGDLVILGQDVNHVSFLEVQLVLALTGVVIDGNPHIFGTIHVACDAKMYYWFITRKIAHL